MAQDGQCGCGHQHQRQGSGTEACSWCASGCYGHLDTIAGARTMPEPLRDSECGHECESASSGRTSSAAAYPAMAAEAQVPIGFGNGHALSSGPSQRRIIQASGPRS